MIVQHHQPCYSYCNKTLEGGSRTLKVVGQTWELCTESSCVHIQQTHTVSSCDHCMLIIWLSYIFLHVYKMSSCRHTQSKIFKQNNSTSQKHPSTPYFSTHCRSLSGLSTWERAYTRTQTRTATPQHLHRCIVRQTNLLSNHSAILLRQSHNHC